MSRLARLLPLRSVGTSILCTLALTLPASSAVTFTTIDPPDVTGTLAVGLSGKRIVGYYGGPGSVVHGFLATK